MTGQDFQDKLNAIVTDLQTTGKGQTVQVMFRNPDNTAAIFPLTSSAIGTVDGDKLAPLQAYVDGLKATADAYETNIVPVKDASAAFANARNPHVAKIDAATAARVSLATDLDADANYQQAKLNYQAAREAAPYVSARSDYKNLNLSENFAELSQAKGSYVGATGASPDPAGSPPPDSTTP